MTQRPVVTGCYQVAAQVEEVRDGGVHADESLRLEHRFEPSHSPLSYPGRLMRQLSAIVRVSTGVVPVLGTKLPRAKDHQWIVVAFRSNTMTPNDSKNLNLFLDAFAKVGRYVLLPAVLFDEGKLPELIMEHWIGKTELTVRPAWQVGDNEPDMMALRPDDDPILPPGMEESAPVLAALARIRAIKRG